MEHPIAARYEFGGVVGERLNVNNSHWMLTVPAANPAITRMFVDRDRTPYRDMVPWAGEFAGKYLIAAVQGLRISRSARLRKVLKSFVADLIAGQGEDGYMGPWPRHVRMMQNWDLWGQYHCMLGLYLWHLETGDRQALDACLRCADYFCGYFPDGGRRVVQAGSEEMNESSIHIFTLLYQHTGEERYLRMARLIEEDWQMPPSGDYVRSALAGKAFWECPKPRWESLHGIQAIAELYFITGDERYRRAYEQTWWSIVQGDRHNNGGFSSGEKATGNPYDVGAIETCCTIAWMAVTLDMLRMTGEARAADELEMSTWNSVLGAQSPSGRWWTYNTPMDGHRLASAHSIVFQARAGQPELNCCSVNAPRGLGILSEWAVMTAPDGLVVNWYGPAEFKVRIPSGVQVVLSQSENYLAAGGANIVVQPEAPADFTIRVRVPGWSRSTKVRVNGRVVPGTEPGSYKALRRTWKAGDTVELTFDIGPRLWVGEREQEGKVSIYHGPVLLAYDPRFDVHDPTALPRINPSVAPQEVAPSGGFPEPLLLKRFAAADGGAITLCDFATAGACGNQYVSWLLAQGVPPAAPFDRKNPLRLA
jgi:hypothetical protein